MVKHIAKIFPDKFQEMGKEDALVIIHEGMEKSSGYGVKSERDVALFVDLMIGIGHNFDIIKETAWIRTILDDMELPPSDRMDLIYKQLPMRKP